jgi:hypothetical protein
VDRLDRLRARALQDARAIDHGVQSGEERRPSLRGRGAVQVDRHDLVHAEGRLRGPRVHARHDTMPARGERRCELAPDEAVGSQQQDPQAHAAAPARRGGAPAGRL